MKTILIQSQKGGSGKTMLAAHLSVEAERSHDPAWLIDTDRQATLSRWHERRKNETPQRLDTTLDRIEEGWRKLPVREPPIVLLIQRRPYPTRTADYYAMPI